MIDAVATTTLRARRAGPIAWRILRSGGRGAVRSVFARSAYLKIGDSLVCIGSPTLGNGPLNLLCEPWPEGMGLDVLASSNDVVATDGFRLLIGGGLRVVLAGLSEWRPLAMAPWRADSLRLGLAICASVSRESVPTEGLAPLLQRHLRIDDKGLPAVARAAFAPAAYLASLVGAAIAGESSRVEGAQLAPLLGLGPGLTPSGDDFLGGALIALARIDLPPLRDAIWGAIAPLAPVLTNEISGAHLAAAADGLGSAALHALLDAVLAGDAPAIERGVYAVVAIGHTSGWDALAGAIAVLRTYAHAGDLALIGRAHA